MTNLDSSKKIAKISMLHSTFVAISAVTVGLGVALYMFSATYFTDGLLDICLREGEFYEGLCTAMGSDASRIAEWSQVLVIIGIVGVISTTIISRIKINSIKE